LGRERLSGQNIEKQRAEKSGAHTGLTPNQEPHTSHIGLHLFMSFLAGKNLRSRGGFVRGVKPS